MLDKWNLHEWIVFALCCVLGLAWLLYAYGIWFSSQPSTNFDKEHDREES